MSANDGATTQLFTGWSSVVHQPEDEPEESELPSTVDIGALSAEPSEPSQAQNVAESESESEDSEADSSNSDDEASQESCSHSDSSDSDSSSSSQESSSRSPSPEFSVTSTQTNGLRLTIATVRKSTNSPINTIKKNLIAGTVNKGVVRKVKGSKKSTSSSSSNCSSDSENSDESDSKSETKSPQKQVQNTISSSKKVAPVSKLRISSTNSTLSNNKSGKDVDKIKQSPLSAKSRPTATVNTSKECPVPKLRLSNSNSSIGGSNRDKDAVNKEKGQDNVKGRPQTPRDRENSSSRDGIKEPPSERTRISSTTNSNNLNSLNNNSKEQSRESVVLPKLRSGSGASSVFSKDKDNGLKDLGKEKEPIGKFRSSSIVNTNNKDNAREVAVKDKEVEASSKGRGSNNVNAKDNIDNKEKELEFKDNTSISKLRILDICNSNVSNSHITKVRERDGISKDTKDEENKTLGSKGSDAKGYKKKIKLKKRSKKMASLPLSRSSTYSSSDSESSDDLLPASCSLQEIRQEDLAAILPDQSECNDFNDFDKGDKDSPATGDMSGSDMELPQQAINSLIQRTTESSSDGEGHQLPNPQTLFANSLLQQFAPNNPLLSPPNGHDLALSISDGLSPSKSLNGSAASTASCQSTSVTSASKISIDSNSQSVKSESSVSTASVKKGRGRPKKGARGRKRKTIEGVKNLESSGEKSLQDFCGRPNVSPDSGIQNSPDHVSSPEPSLSPNIRLKHSAPSKEESKKTASLSIMEPRSRSRMAKVEKLTPSNSRNTSQERHSKRLASQEKQGRNASQEKLDTRGDVQEKPPTRGRHQELYSSRNSSQGKQDGSRTTSREKHPNRTTSQEKPQTALRSATQEKHSNRTSSQSGSSRNSSQEKVKESLSKISVTSNQFDRVLYANSDRVLYPPRRKAGRPPVRRPGRPPKNKVDCVDAEKSASGFKGKGRSRLLSHSGQKQGSIKSKSITLKVPKILHSKHRHKHKKRKFKILKPLVSSDPKINQEIEKLIVDFVKYCVIASKQPKENVPEQILKTLKKVSKKRRNTDYMEKKKKKQNVSTTVNKIPNSNEQRLPLKKRHYHLASNSSETQKLENEESKEKVPDRPEDPKSKTEKKEKTKDKDGKVTPKYLPVIKSHINNNEYEVKSEKIEKDTSAHIEEAIEACINKISDEKLPKIEENSPDSKTVPATTPKKRHRLENLNPDNDDTPLSAKATAEIKTETVAPSFEEKFEKLKSSLTVESYINELKMKRSSVVSQKSTEEGDGKSEKDEKELKIKNETSATLQVEKTVPVSPESTKKKVRKRRAFNRTGFPTVKRKKKKTFPSENTETRIEEIKEVDNTPVCDRVPKEGEEITKFLQRSSANNSMQDLTTINSAERPPSDDIMSECESLPQDERIEFDLEDGSSRSESVADNQSESRRSKVSDVGDSETLSLLESSIERLKSRLDHKKRKRNKDLKNLPEVTNTYPKRRRREDSPASSIEPLLENRLRDSASASGDELPKKSKKAPRWRKKYLVAGLFSDYYKEDESKRQENSKSTRNPVYNPEEHPFGLLPPPYHCGKYLRCRKLDFQLPYDLWWQHTHAQLPGRDIVPSWNYRKIRTNVYNVKSNGGACEPQTCNCKTTSDCGDDCINRLVLAECPTSHRCNNQRIQKHEWAPGIEKFMTEDKGWGVRTKDRIRQGDFILEYVGEVVSDQEFKERMNSIYVNDTHHYCLHLDSGLVIDGHRMGGDGRFVNHSCQPNCEMQKWSVNSQFRMALFALRDIEPYEELTYDYNFSLFNPAEGQECKCLSEQCRGVIGGKTQRIRQLPETASTVAKIPGRVGRPRKTEAKKKPSTSKDSIVPSNNPPTQPQVVPQIQVKPMSHQQKCFILEHHCFLLRNLTKVRKVRDRSQSVNSNPVSRQQSATPTDTSAFMNQLNALQKPRNIKTRRIAQAEDDPELNKTVKLAAILKSILLTLTTEKGDNNELLSSHLHQLPSKRKLPEFYQRVQDPVDLSTIEQNVATGVYKTPQAFDEDMIKLFAGFSKYYGRTTDVGIAAAKLKKLYTETKQKSLAKFEDVLGEKPPPAFINNKRKNEEEDIIRCICGIPRDEGLMIQCERCTVWQHIECVKADASVASYHCELCVPRDVDYEIPMDDFTEHGHRYYMTLMRGSLQLRQGDTVYVLRDIPIPGTDKKHTYETIGKIDYSELDIFRIERLWKDKDTGQRFAYGHHYLRPHETFHEPTRKFFSNEVMRVPLYEAVPVELVMERCWVMDINTFCKGRPIGAQEEHVYICEYRVDKGAKMFSKVSKSKFPICTKSFAFERFETRLKISRTYCPHDVDASLLKNGGVGRRRVEKDKDKEKTITKESASNSSVTPVQPVAPPVQRTPAQQKARLNKILLNLLSKMPTKQVIDVSYLLEGGRRRKKQEAKH